MGESETTPLMNGNTTRRTATVGQSFLNLLNFTVGGTALLMPFAFKCVGVIGCLALMLLAWWLNWKTGSMLLDCARIMKHASYETLVAAVFGERMAKLLQVSTVLLLFGTLAVVTSIIRDLSWQLAEYAGIAEWFVVPELLLIVVLILFVIPLCCIDSLTALSAINLPALAIFVLLGLVIMVISIHRGLPATHSNVPLLIRLNSNSFLSFPIVSFCFFFTPLLFAVKDELKEQHKITSIIHATMASTFVIDAVFGIFGFLLFGDATLSDVLLNFEKAEPVTVVLCFCTWATTILTSPLTNYPVAHVSLLMLYGPPPHPRKRRVVACVVIVASAALVAFLIPDIA